MKFGWLQGGLSRGVFRQPVVAEYIAGPSVLGYIGHDARTPQLDAALEAALRKELHMDDAEIAMFVTWKIGRYLGDQLAKVQNLNHVGVAVAMFARQRMIAKAIVAMRVEVSESNERRAAR